MFRITGGKGLHMKLANDYLVSIQFGAGNYCDNYDSMDYDNQTGLGQKGSGTAEVYIFDDSDKPKMPRKYKGNPAGYCSADEVANLIAWAKRQKRSVKNV